MIQFRKHPKLLVLLLAICMNTVHSRPVHNCQENEAHLNLLISSTSETSNSSSIGSSESDTELSDLSDAGSSLGSELPHSGASDATEAPDRQPAADERQQDEVSDEPMKRSSIAWRCGCHCGDNCRRANTIITKLDGECILSDKFDHNDYAVSDLEFQIVLRRLRSQSDVSSIIRTTTVAEAASATVEADVLVVNKYPELNPSECHICLGDFDQSYMASSKSNRPDGATIDDSEAVADVESETTTSPTSLEMQTDIVLLVCGHKFHLACIRAWSLAGMAQSHKCPICGAKLRLCNGECLTTLATI